MMRCKKQPIVCRGACREQVFNGLRTKAVGADLTTVRCKGQGLPLGVTVDALSGLALTIDQLSAEDIEARKTVGRADCPKRGSAGAGDR
jgi:hypothetical protein